MTLNCLETLIFSFFFLLSTDLFPNICKKSWLTSHLGSSSAPSGGWVVSSVRALFQKHKIPDTVKFFSYIFVDKRRTGKGREGKAAVRNARARCCIARPEASGTLCYGNGHKNAPPCLRKWLFKAELLASPPCHCCLLDVACVNNISTWKKTFSDDSAPVAASCPRGEAPALPWKWRLPPERKPRNWEVSFPPKPQMRDFWPLEAMKVEKWDTVFMDVSKGVC